VGLAVLSASFTASLGSGASTRPVWHTKTPRVSVFLVGDSLAFTLGFGLNEPALKAKYHYNFSFLGILGCGIAEGPKIIDRGVVGPANPACNGSTPAPGTPLGEQPWPVQWRAALTKYHANVVALLAGRWEDIDRLYRGKFTNILNPVYAAYIKQQMELASNLVTATGANMVFLTAPCTDEGVQPDGQPWPQDSPARRAVYDRLAEQVAAEHPSTDSVIDLNAAVCPNNQFAAQVDGVTIRTSDGVHFTDAAGPVVARAIMPELLAAGRDQMARIARERRTKTGT